MEFDIEKPDWELDLLDALAGKRLKVKEAVDPTDPDLSWTAEIRTWGFGVFVRGRTRAAARWRLVEALAFERLEKELRRMGWTEIKRFSMKPSSSSDVTRPVDDGVWEHPMTTLSSAGGSSARSRSRISIAPRSSIIATSSTQRGSR